MKKSNFSGLDLQGYKTFAKETNLVFPSKITAIVGPNGSGKSNVADAIRWVLGEQSYSLLRAKKTEDMIYSGSDNRARAGMAAVSIRFNNEDKWLPIDYSEVVLSRRAYRDGKNEYLINNQRVRLKDFNELLGKTGLSDRTYTIIGQGLVDSALSIRPNERSKLFEEAAGIGLYQNRKEEALRRLEATERNLERSLDIIVEIKPRVRSLEKQAARVGEFKAVQEALKESLRDWYGYHWFKALKDVNKTQQLLHTAQLDQQSARKAFEKEQLEVTTLRSEIETQRELVNNLMNKLRDLRDQLQQDNQSLAILDERKVAAEKARLQVINDLTNLEEVIRAAEERSKAYKLDENKMREELETVQRQFENLSVSRTKILQQETNLRKQENQLREAQIEVEKEAVVIRSRKQEMTERLSTLQSSQHTIQTNLDGLENEQRKLQGIIQELSLNVHQAEQDLLLLKQDADKTLEERSEVLKDLESYQQSSHKLDLEKNRVKNRLELIKQSRESLAGFSAGARSLLKSSREKRLRTELTDLATHIEVPEEFETAISAALGEAVDVLIVQGKHLGSALVEEFSAALEDRVAVLSQGTLKQDLNSPAETHAGLLIASGIVKSDQAFRPVVDLLLGDFVIVDDISSAFELREKHPQLNFATRSGEVLLKNGIVLIGKANKSSKVSYTRLVNELTQQLEEIDVSSAKMAHAVGQLKSKMEKIDAKLAENQQQSQQKQNSRDNLNKQLQATSLSLEKARGRASWIERQQSENQSTQETLTAALEKLNRQEQENQQKTQALADQLQKFRLKRADFQPENIENQYRYLETEKQILSQSLNHLLETLKADRQRLEADKLRKANFLIRIADHERVLGELESQISTLVETVGRDQELINSLQEASLDPGLEKLRNLESQSRRYSETNSNNQQFITEKDRQVIHFQLELAHQQERLENLKSRIDDDFSLIEMEYRKEHTQSAPLPFPDLVIDTLPEILEIPESLSATIKQQKTQIRRIGTVNMEADQEFREVKERFDSLNTQVADLTSAISDIRQMIRELDTVMQSEFLRTFKAVSSEFTSMFSRLFNGGSARLILSDDDSPIDGGIEIEARLPGKREQGLVLLSGGERSLTAVALVFALLKVSPTPFCVLDEVDAMLDESNVGRFIELLKDLSSETQFILITHNRNTVSAADVIYGVTMGKDSSSQVISMRLDEVDDSFVH
ncbi:MAG: chromosome segregation protein SMC [Anaerolineaceae bacterium]|nr:chromosome segregation protein SMC [Anaerolineaceae bacterium]